MRNLDIADTRAKLERYIYQLDLIDRLCDGLVILHDGHVVASGTRAELETTGRIRHRIVLAGDAGWLRDLADIRVEDVDGNTALFELLAPGAEQRILTAALERGNVLEFTVVRPTLADLVVATAKTAPNNIKASKNFFIIIPPKQKYSLLIV